MLTLKAVYDRGLNTWDTSCSYSNGDSQEILGKAIRQYNISRTQADHLDQILQHLSRKQHRGAAGVEKERLGGSSRLAPLVQALSARNLQPRKCIAQAKAVELSSSQCRTTTRTSIAKKSARRTSSAIKLESGLFLEIHRILLT